MLDTDAEIRLRLEDGAGAKQAVLRWPADDEWIQREKNLRTVIYPVIGGGTFTETQGNERAAFDLFQAIRADTDGPAFDEYEAADVIERLLEAGVLEVEHRGAEVDVRLTVAGGNVVTHTLGFPMARERHVYNKFTTLVSFDRWREWRRDLAGIAGMWDELVLNVEGCTGEIPLPHKAAAMAELMALASNVGSARWVTDHPVKTEDSTIHQECDAGGVSQ